MDSTDSVTVGIDGSWSALQAVRWAAREATLRNVVLRIVHASPRYPELGHGTERPAWRLASQIAHGLVGRARQAARAAEPDLAIETSVLTNAPSRTLIECSLDTALVVVAARGLDGFAGLHLGSVATTVSAYAQCPVVVVRPPAVPAGGHPAPVVVGVDGSPDSEHALGFAFAFASRRTRPVVAVHCWRNLSPHAVHQVLTEAANQQDLAHDEEQVLDKALSGWCERYPDVPVSRVVRRERAVSALLDFSPQAELLVVASRGRGGFTGMVLSSTSQAIVRYASGPVAVVHPQPGVGERAAESGSLQASN